MTRATARRRMFGAVAAVALLVLTACGGGSDDGDVAPPEVTRSRPRRTPSNHSTRRSRRLPSPSACARTASTCPRTCFRVGDWGRMTSMTTSCVPRWRSAATRWRAIATSDRDPTADHRRQPEPDEPRRRCRGLVWLALGGADRSWWARGTSLQRTDASHELGEGEGLGKLVVCAQTQTFYPSVDLSGCGQHQDARRGTFGDKGATNVGMFAPSGSRAHLRACGK